MLRGDSVLPAILRSYGWAAETFAASDKGWHDFFADTPHGPRFLHPKELAVAQGFPWGFTLPSCRTQAWQLLGNSVHCSPPMAYLGLVGPAAALRDPVAEERGTNWAAEGFRRCCRANDGACESRRGALELTHRADSPRPSRTPPASGASPGDPRDFRCRPAEVADPPSGHGPEQACLRGGSPVLDLA